MKKNTRVVFLDYLRVFACLMVMVVHACEQFYFNDNGEFAVASRGSAAWTVFIDSAGRASVPLFVMASAYLLFPLHQTVGDFLRRRFLRVCVPFALFSIAYTIANSGSWGQLLFNFPMATGGHLWFVPMLLGVYLMMILLSPWAEKATEREVRGWLAVWVFTTLFPYLRRLYAYLYGEPSFGAVSFLYGECPWNAFGTFQYVSGFFGYVLLGFWFRRFAPTWSWRKTLLRAVPLWAVGYAIVALGFWFRIPFDGTFPLVKPYATAVDLEMSWEFCSVGVLLTTIGYFLVLRRITADGVFYRRVIRPLSDASYCMYLVHIFFLVAIMPFLKGHVPVSVAIVCGGLATFAASGFFGILARRIPVVGRLLCG